MAQKYRILIADDEPLYLRTTGELLDAAGYNSVCVASGQEALERLRSESFDLVLTDLNMPGNQHLELLRDHSAHRPGIPMIVVTGAPTLPSAIESVRLGITDYLLKPVRYDDLLSCVKRALAALPMRTPASIAVDQRAGDLAAKFPGIVGQSQPMLDVLDVVARVAATNTNVLITGESGTGKEVLARALHQQSHRRNGPFQVIDCTAIPESLFESVLFGHRRGSFTGAVRDQTGLLEQSDHGTAFFDELGELHAVGQAKLLRAVQECAFTPIGGQSPVTIDTRFVCATNRDLENEVKSGRFRQDLYYRLGVIHIHMPALRERGDDVLLLAEHFVGSINHAKQPIAGFSTPAKQALRSYSWPGNIRELRNAVERALALAKGSQIELHDLPTMLWQSTAVIDSGPRENNSAEEASPPDQAVAGQSRGEAIASADAQYIDELLRQHHGNVSRAARQAGMSRQSLHKLLIKHGLRAADYRT